MMRPSVSTRPVRRLAEPALPVAWSAALLLAALAGGCVSTRTIEQDVASSRAAAATRLQAPREDPSALLLEGPLSLETAVRSALVHNHEVRVAALGRRVAHGQVLESYGVVLPRATLQGSYTRLDEAGRIEVGGQSLPMGFEDNTSVDLSLRQPLYQGAAIPATLRAARLQQQASEHELQRAGQRVVQAVAQLYADWLLAIELAAVEDDALALAEALAEDTRRRGERGLASDYDLLRTVVEVSNQRAQQLRARNAVALARSRLLHAIGAAAASDVTPADTLRHEPLEADPAAAQTLAQTERPELRSAELALRAQHEAVRIARSAYAPRADAFFTHQWANPDPHASMRDEWGTAWRAGLAVNWTLFDGFERRGRVVQQEARLEQSREQLRALEETVALEVEQALLRLRHAEELVESQRLNLERAHEALRLMQVGRRQGVQSDLAILDAQTAVTRSRTLHHQALHAHTLARLDLLHATGRLTPERLLAHSFPPTPVPTQP